MTRKPRPIIPIIYGLLVALNVFKAVTDDGIWWWIAAGLWVAATALTIKTYRIRVETWHLYQDIERLQQRNRL